MTNQPQDQQSLAELRQRAENGLSDALNRVREDFTPETIYAATGRAGSAFRALKRMCVLMAGKGGAA